MIDYINGLDTTWKAGPNFIGKDEKYVRRLCGALESKMPPLKKITPLEDIPDEFDSRTNWPDCATIRDIRDQADCGSIDNRDYVPGLETERRAHSYVDTLRVR